MSKLSSASPSVALAHLAGSKSCNSHMFYTEFNLTLFPCFSVHIAVYQYDSVKTNIECGTIHYLGSETLFD